MKKLIVAVAALAMLTGSAYAAEWNFYGNARVSTFYADKDIADTTNLEMGVQSNSRIGAKIKVSDELTANFEYGTGVNVRHLYGEWNFGAGKLLVGQTWNPYWMSVSNQVYATDLGLGGIGENYAGRSAQIRLTFGDFVLAFVEPDLTVYDAAGDTFDGDEVKFPKIQAKYTYRADMWNAGIAGSYQTFDVEEESVDSWAVAATVRLTMDNFGLRAQAWTGTNTGNIAATDAGSDFGAGYAVYEAGKVYDVDAMGFALIAEMKINDMFSVEAGYGYVELEASDDSDMDDEAQSYYLQVPITLAPGVYIIPEVGVIDYKETGQEETTYYGAKWQINF